MYVDPVQERTGNLAPVALNVLLRAVALMLGVSTVPARAGIHCSDQHERAGKVTASWALEMVTLPSSSGWRSTSRTFFRNSGSSSKKSTPLCAKETSPGRESCHRR